jgi:hypothetical protein
VVYGKQIETEESENNEESSERAGHDGSGDVELKVDEQSARTKTTTARSGLARRPSKPFAQGWFEVDDGRTN